MNGHDAPEPTCAPAQRARHLSVVQPPPPDLDLAPTRPSTPRPPFGYGTAARIEPQPDDEP